MMEGLGLRLPQMGKRLKVTVWAVLLSLTVVILLYPVQLRFEFVPMQSIYIFKCLPAFCTLYVFWFASLLWLLLSLGGSKKDNWLRIALIAIFAIVYFGFWAVITPQGFTSDYEGGALSHSSYILGGGTVSNALSGAFGYFQFPFTAFLGAGLSRITGLSLLDVRLVVLLFGSALFGMAMFVFLKNTMKNASLASVGAILVMQGSLVFSRSLRFYPTGIGLILFALFLMLLVRNKGLIFESWWGKVVAIVLMVAITTNHYITSFYVIGVLLAIYFVQLFARKRLIKPLLIIPLAIIPLLWGIFWATPMVSYMLGKTSDVTATIVATSQNNTEVIDEVVDVGGDSDIGNGNTVIDSGGEVEVVDDIPASDVVETPSLSLWWVDTMVTAYLGAGMPWWGKAIMVFWVLASYVFGGILAFINLFRLRRLDTAGQIFTGGMLGVIAVSTLAVLATLKLGGYEYFRFLQFGCFFAIPLVLGLVWSLRRFRKQIIIGLLIIPLFVLSLPTFLAHNNTIEADAVYPEEIAACKILEAEYGKGDEVGVFTSEMNWTLTLSYLPNADYFVNECLVYTPKDVFYRGVESLLENYDNYMDEKVFVFTPRFYWYYYHIYGITVDNPKWDEFRDKLAGLEKVYDNGFVQIYK